MDRLLQDTVACRHPRISAAEHRGCCGGACAEAGWIQVTRLLMEQMQAYFEGRACDFTVQTDWLTGTDFQRAIWRAAQQIEYGKTCGYGELAALAGHPGAARAVGGCMAANPTPLLVPCHRVVSASGKLVGFSATGGVETKQRLLELERGTLL
ncbi:TPA: cysteine methyltransferase [Candidatus Sumerlaeota bacterium]|nr:cysteine methyltransferase [Candidatus Sumerlaeota bacterium]